MHLLSRDDGVVELPALPHKSMKASLLGGKRARVRQSNGELRQTFDKRVIDPIDTILRLELDGSAMNIPAIALPSENNTMTNAAPKLIRT